MPLSRAKHLIRKGHRCFHTDSITARTLAGKPPRLKCARSLQPNALELSRAERVVQSFSDPEARLYYRFYFGTLVGDKHLCVVVKVTAGDAFVLTAYLTDQIKKGVTIWPKEE